MFEKFIAKSQENPLEEPVYNITMNIQGNPLLSKEALKSTLYNFKDYDDQSLFNIIRETLDTILSDIFKKDENRNYLDLITNSRFLSIFIRAVGSSKLTYDQKIKCNKLAYDYLVTENRDPNIERLFFGLSKVVNKDSVSLLMAIGIPENLADYMALSRFSSQKEVVNVKRLNFIIMSSDPKLMTVQNIILIYEKLFDRLLPLFEGVMTDSISDDADYMTDDMWLIYSCISLAVLEIINNAPSELIIGLLRAYNETYYKYYGKVTPRFNINSISDDYKRILNCLDILKIQENIVF